MKILFDLFGIPNQEIQIMQLIINKSTKFSPIYFYLKDKSKESLKILTKT